MATSDSASARTETGPRSVSEALRSTRPAITAVRLVAYLKRWPAYLLAVCWPGTGHLYRRHWTRGCSWAALYGAALFFLSSGTTLAAGSVTEPLLVTALRLESVAFGDVAMPLTVLSCSVIDLVTLNMLDKLS